MPSLKIVSRSNTHQTESNAPSLHSRIAVSKIVFAELCFASFGVMVIHGMRSIDFISEKYMCSVCPSTTMRNVLFGFNWLVLLDTKQSPQSVDVYIRQRAEFVRLVKPFARNFLSDSNIIGEGAVFA